MHAPRAFSGGGALVVGFRAVARARRSSRAQAPRMPAPSCRAASTKSPMLDAWIRIDADGAVTVFTGKVELGQGIKTALSQIAAEELDWRSTRIALITGDTARTPNEGYTAGSQSMQDSGTAIRHAAAQVRELLLERGGGKRLGVARGALTSRRRRGQRADGRQRRLWRAGRRPAAAGRRAAPSRRSGAGQRYTLIGKPVPRRRHPGEGHRRRGLRAGPAAAGMVHARVVRPPRYGARLNSRRHRGGRKACRAW